MLNLETVRKIAWENMGSRRAHEGCEVGYIYYHGLRTANLAGEILFLRDGDRTAFDEKVFAGGLFHDIGKGFGAHNEAGAAITRHLLNSCCTPEELDDICDIVRFHCIRKHQLDLPEKILAIQDADIIDHYGTQQIWLGMLRASYHDESATSLMEYWNSDEFRDHLEELRELLNYQESCAIFEERIDFLTRFNQRFQTESEGRIFNDTDKKQMTDKREIAGTEMPRDSETSETGTSEHGGAS